MRTYIQLQFHDNESGDTKNVANFLVKPYGIESINGVFYQIMHRCNGEPKWGTYSMSYRDAVKSTFINQYISKGQ